MENSKPQIKPPITYFGNKANIARWICGYFPLHHTYVEPFGGSASVMLAKRPSKVEVYNDINKELVTLFQVLRDEKDFQRLKESLHFTLHAREEFSLAKQTNIDDPVEIARRAIIKFRQSHGGHADQWSHCIEASTAGMSASVRKWLTGIENLPEIHQRMQRVQVESLDWQEVIKKYDTENTLFYLDPPYIKDTRINGKYQHEITRENHIQLVNILLSIKGKAILSGYKHPTYAPLLDYGWRLVRKEVIAHSSNDRAIRIECLWISPNAKKQKNTGILKAKTGQEDFFSSSLEKMKKGAYYTHGIRTDYMANLIAGEIERFKRIGRKVTKTAIAESLNISREHVNRRYKHLFL